METYTYSSPDVWQALPFEANYFSHKFLNSNISSIVPHQSLQDYFIPFKTKETEEHSYNVRIVGLSHG